METGCSHLAGVSYLLALALSGFGQHLGTPLPRFENYPVAAVFKEKPAVPILTTAEERRYRTVIRRGMEKGYGVSDTVDGRERPGPNFAGRYYIITWGCGSPCLMAAIVDGKTGRVFPPPFHHGPGHSYFQVPWAFPMGPALDYRLNSRLLIANICENTETARVGKQIGFQSKDCGAHYFLMDDSGLRLLRRTLAP